MLFMIASHGFLIHAVVALITFFTSFKVLKLHPCDVTKPGKFNHLLLHDYTSEAESD